MNFFNKAYPPYSASRTVLVLLPALVILNTVLVLVSLGIIGWLPFDSAPRQIAYYGQQGNYGAIYLMDIDRVLTVAIHQTTGSVNSLSWSSDGEYLAFVTYEDGYYWLHKVSADGQNAQQLTDQSASSKRPVWSPDSQIIAFESQDFTRSAIYLIDANGEHLRSLTGSANSDLIWSPDGTKVALASWESSMNTQEIYVMEAEPCLSEKVLCQPERLTENSAADRLPVWSPDGQQIAFLSDRSGQWEIYVLDVDCVQCGRETRQLTDMDIPGNTSLKWSPDSRWLAFEWVPADYSSSLIYLLDMTCKEISNFCLQRITETKVMSRGAEWSPDGQQIAYTVTQAEPPQIMLLNIACIDPSENCPSEKHRLTQPDIISLFPVWRPR